MTTLQTILKTNTCIFIDFKKAILHKKNYLYITLIIFSVLQYINYLRLPKVKSTFNITIKIQKPPRQGDKIIAYKRTANVNARFPPTLYTQIFSDFLSDIQKQSFLQKIIIKFYIIYTKIKILIKLLILKQ